MADQTLPIDRKPDNKLIALGTLIYNGFTFPQLAEISEVVEDVYDDAGIQVMYRKCRLSVVFEYAPTMEYLSSEIPPSAAGDVSNYNSMQLAGTLALRMDELAQDLKRRLLQPGQPLYYSRMGTGTLNVNSGDPQTSDLLWGPKPLSCSWSPVIGNVVASFKWEVEYHIPPVCQSNAQYHNILGYSYSVDWDQNEQDGGLLSRTISGSVVLKGSRAPTPTQIANNSAYVSPLSETYRYVWEFLRKLFPKIKGFFRSKHFTLSSDYRTLSFSITDKEIMSEWPFPRPILDMQITQTVESDLSQGFKVWKVGYSGRVSVSKSRLTDRGSLGQQKSLAWVAIGAMVRRRLDLFIGRYNREKRTGVSSDGPIVFDRMQIRDTITGNDFSFELQYRLFTDEVHLFGDAGIFKPFYIAGETWTRREQYFEQIGTDLQNVEVLPTDLPPIVSFCKPLPEPVPNPGPVVQNRFDDVINYMEANELEAPKETSHKYFEYKNNYDVQELNQSSFHVPLRSGTEARQESAQSQKEFVAASGYSSQSQSAPKVHNPIGVYHLITMHGYAVRVGDVPAMPNLLSYGGLPVKKVGRDRVSRRSLAVGVALDPTKTSTDVYGLTWTKTYIVQGLVSSSQPSLLVTDRSSLSPNETQAFPQV